MIGSSEIVIALLIAARPFSARLSSIGSILAGGTLLDTLSFLVTTPGVWHFTAGFPMPVPNLVGAFLIKDLFLLGASLWTAGDGQGGRLSRLIFQIVPRFGLRFIRIGSYGEPGLDKRCVFVSASKGARRSPRAPRGSGTPPP